MIYPLQSILIDALVSMQSSLPYFCYLYLIISVGLPYWTPKRDICPIELLEFYKSYTNKQEQTAVMLHFGDSIDDYHLFVTRVGNCKKRIQFRNTVLNTQQIAYKLNSLIRFDQIKVQVWINNLIVVYHFYRINTV